MVDPTDSPEEAALWQRWRHAASPPAGERPDALALAAYAEGRLGEAEAEVIENWLSADPDLAGDVMIARQTALAPLPGASESIIGRASALVPANQAGVVVLRPPSPRQPNWRGMVRWSAMAASVLVASAIGFALGNDAYVSLASTGSAALGQELLDPPAGLFTGFDEDVNI